MAHEAPFTRDRERVERVKARNSIIDVARRLGFRLPDHRLNSRLIKAVCLLHKDKDPSFTLYPGEGRFYCYGCKKRGDVINLYMAATSSSFSEALDHLDAGRYARVTAARPTTPPPPPTPSERSLTAINIAAKWFHRRLFDSRGREGRDYLASRRVTRGTATSLKLGYAPWDGFVQYMAHKCFGPKDLRDSGLTVRGSDSDTDFSDDYQRFQNMIVIPHVAADGRADYLYGRRIRDKRFQCLPFNRPMLGLEMLGDAECVVLTEGLFDWISLKQWDLPAVALSGTHGRATWGESFKDFRHVVTAFDSDDAGAEAVERTVEQLGAERAAAVTLPNEVKDIGELALLDNGQDDFRSALSALSEQRGWHDCFQDSR